MMHGWWMALRHTHTHTTTSHLSSRGVVSVYHSIKRAHIELHAAHGNRRTVSPSYANGTPGLPGSPSSPRCHRLLYYSYHIRQDRRTNTHTHTHKYDRICKRELIIMRLEQILWLDKHVRTQYNNKHSIIFMYICVWIRKYI